MFGLTIVDHVCLSLTRSAENYTVHARAAERLATLASRMRIVLLALLFVAAAASVIGLVEVERPYQIAAVIAAGVAFGAQALCIAYGVEGRVHAHRACAHKLWLVCERHRALLAEIQDGLLDCATILKRRDELTLETHGAYDQAFAVDQTAWESVRHSADSSERSSLGSPQADQLVA